MDAIFSFPPGPEYNGTEFEALFALNCVELGSHLFLDCPFAVLNFALVFRSSVLHPNLKFILLCQSACIFVRGIARLILIPARLLAENNLMSRGSPTLFWIYIFPTYARNFIVHVMIIERILATRYFRTYEQWRSRWFSIGWLLLTSAISIGNATTSTAAPKNVATNVSMTIYYACVSLGALEIAALFWILQYNDRIYQNKVHNTHSLSERYQLSENIRTAKQLIPCILLHYVNILAGATGGTINMYRLFGENQFLYDLICNQQVYTTVSLISFGIELSMIFCHPFLRRDCQRIWANICSCHLFFNNSSTGTAGRRRGEQQHSSAIAWPSRNLHLQQHQQNQVSAAGDGPTMLVVKNIHGRPLEPQERGQANEQYFRHLNDAWRSDGGRNIVTAAVAGGR